MRTKALLTSIVLATTAIAGVASADPIVRDHRYAQPVSYRAPVRYQNQIRVQSRPSWMVNASANVNYGFQLDADGDEVQPYAYGQDPYVEGIARGEWFTLASNVELAPTQGSRQFINLQGRPLRSLELRATRGDTYIEQIAVQLTNGQEIKLHPNREVDAREPNLRVDLGANCETGVNRVIVYGSTPNDGTFQVIGG